jgi:aminopeptidase N
MANRHVRRNLAVILFCLFLAHSVSFAQFGTHPEEKDLMRNEANAYRAYAAMLSKVGIARSQIDVSYYKLNLKILGSAPRPQISGTVTSTATVLDPSITSVTLDMSNDLIVDSVVIDGNRLNPGSWAHASALLVMNTPRVYGVRENITIRVTYHGSPVGTGFGSFGAQKLSDGTTDWFWTLSEPYGASDWWPCIDHPSDKADSVDIWLTCSQNYTAVSQGKLVATVINGDGTKTYEWQHRYPIASYLISATITNFSEFSSWYQYSPTDSMEIFNYVTPTIGIENPNYQSAASLAPRMMQIYSSLFGQYPFIKEKYGHAEFGWRGGMEHQTLTSLGTGAFNEAIIAHELAHQWFGDMITCRTWPDVWLNEGFATYCEALYREKQYGEAAYTTEMGYILAASKEGGMGSIYLQDTSSVGNMFFQGRIYNKGASILHMLRHVLGDTTFFAALRAYANDTTLMYKTASTADFRRDCEKVSRKDLGYFFNEWIFGEDYPQYTYRVDVTLQGPTYKVTVTIKQTTSTSNPSFFTMPIDFRFVGATMDTTIVVLNNQRNQVLSFSVLGLPDTVELDPNNWILKDVRNISSGVDMTPVPSTYILEQNYPNPFNPATTIRFSIPHAAIVHITVYNVLGEEIAALINEQMTEGKHAVEWNAAHRPSGVYFYRLQTGGFDMSGKMLLIR